MACQSHRREAYSCAIMRRRPLHPRLFRRMAIASPIFERPRAYTGCTIRRSSRPILDMQTKQNSLLYEDQQIIGIKPAWSPDGTRLSSYDNVKNEFRLLDLHRQPIDHPIPNQWNGDLVGDSSMFVYTDLATNEFGLHTRIREAKSPSTI